VRELKTKLSKIDILHFIGTRQNPTRHHCLTEVGSALSRKEEHSQLASPLIAGLGA